MPGFLSPGKAVPLLLIPEYSGINKGQRFPDRSKTAHRNPAVKCILTSQEDSPSKGNGNPPKYSGLPWWHSGKESVCQCKRCRRPRFNPWVGKIPWSRKWKSTPASLPGKFHGQRSLVGYTCGHKELDTTEPQRTWWEEWGNPWGLTYKESTPII